MYFVQLFYFYSTFIDLAAFRWAARWCGT